MTRFFLSGACLSTFSMNDSFHTSHIASESVVCNSTLPHGCCARSSLTEMAVVEIFQETSLDNGTMITGTFITIFNGHEDSE